MNRFFLMVAATCAVVMFFGCTSAECPQGYCPQAIDVEQPMDGCYDASDCEQQSGKVANCVNGECVYTQINCPAGYELNALYQCVKVPLSCNESQKPEVDACTAEVTCDSDEGEWVITLVNCDDGINATEDSCDEVAGCTHVYTCGGNCSDENPCTKDYCNPETGECKHIALCGEDEVCVAGICSFRCTENSDCDDGNACTMNSCDINTGVCLFTLFPCDDSNDLTVDYCQVVGGKKQCTNVITSCEGNGNDGDMCTVDTCQGGVWKHFALSCGDGTACDPETGMCEIIPIAECNNYRDCDDDNPCTTDSCIVVNGEAQCEHVTASCDEDEVCDAETGDCVDIESPDCEEDPLGSTCDDEDSSTLDYCQSGKCIHTQPISCGEGTYLNPQSGECEPAVSDPTCMDGDAECVIFESSGMVTVATCLEGHWFVLQNCGRVSTGHYCLEEATGPACQFAE